MRTILTIILILVVSGVTAQNGQALNSVEKSQDTARVYKSKDSRVKRALEFRTNKRRKLC